MDRPAVDLGAVGRCAVNPLERLHGLTAEQVRQWLEASCAAQGVPVVVTDAGVLSRVGVLVSGRRRKPQAGATRSQSPRDHDSL